MAKSPSYRRLLPDMVAPGNVDVIDVEPTLAMPSCDASIGVSSSSSKGGRRGGHSAAVEAVLADIDRNKDFAFIAAVAKLVLHFLKKFWAVCSTCTVVLVVLYWFYGGLMTFGLCIVGFLGLLYQIGDLTLYFPNQPPNSRVLVPLPSAYRLPFESVSFPSMDKTKLNAYFIKQPDELFPSAPTLIYLHGNAGNIGHRLADATNMFHTLQCNIFMLEYRGYGMSDGKPSESGLYMDAQASLNHVIKNLRVDPSKVFIFGRSLGGAVGIHLCAQSQNNNRIAGLIVENSFTSIPAMALHICKMPVARYLPRWMFKNKYESIKKVRNVRLPCLFITGEVDNLVPSSMVEDLCNACGSVEKQLVTFPDGGHNDTWTCSGYYDTMAEFMKKAIEIQEAKVPKSEASGEGQVTVRVSDFV